MALLSAIADVVGPAHCAVPPPESALVDFLGRRAGAAGQLLVRPADAAEVSAVMVLCAAEGVPVVVQGGNTGLVRGQLPDDPRAVILSTTRLTGFSDVTDSQLTAAGGVTIAQVHAKAAALRRIYGVDLASRDSATVGGTIATNAGGIRVCAYGSTREQLAGVEIVLADGTVLRDLGGLAKDNTGYDLTGLVCGSEGTLAVVTAARLRLLPPPRPASTAALVVASLTEAHQLAVGAAGPGFELLGAEVVDRRSWAGSAAAGGLADPTRSAGEGDYILLLEVGDDSSGEGFTSIVVDRPQVVVALDPPGRRLLWQVRESQSEYWATLGQVQKFDVSLPPAALDDLMVLLTDQFESLTARPRWGVFGHIHEANLHVEVVAGHGPGSGPDVIERTVLESVAGLRGSISAEHGIGRDKARWLRLRRTDSEIAAMRAIKGALDPDNLLNPGVLLPPV